MKRTITLLSSHFLFASLALFGQTEYQASMAECQSLGYIESQECMKGKPIPSFEGTTYEGIILNQQSIENKVAVINFWFIACPPCIAELDGLNNTVKRYQDNKDVVFISFTREDKQILEEEFFPNYDLDFHIIPDSEAIILEVFRSWWGYPTTIVVDKSGRIHTITSGGKTESEEASREIEEFLSKSIDACLEK
jgi:peroxiredoxin